MQQLNVVTIINFGCDELGILINYLLGVNKVVDTTASFIYRVENTKLAKFLHKSEDGLNAFDFLNDYRIGETFFGGCLMRFAL